MRWKLNGLLIERPYAVWFVTILTGPVLRSLFTSVAQKALSKKWLKRFCQAEPDDVQVLFSRSRARHTLPPPPHPQVVQKIVEIRTSPPEHLQRTPGPRAILYYLHRDPDLQTQGLVPPRSTRTIWKILRQQGYILDAPETLHHPRERVGPLEEIQMDFKDASTLPADPESKKQHVVEVLNFVDAGTSIVLSAQAHPDFHAETALEAVVAFLRQYGLPTMMTFDRDPRWVGSSSGRDFPSALRRFLLCLGIEPHVCPPQRPDKNDLAAYYPPCVRLRCLLIFVSIFHRSVFIGWFKVFTLNLKGLSIRFGTGGEVDVHA